MRAAPFQAIEYSVTDTTQALIKLVHSSDSWNHASRPLISIDHLGSSISLLKCDNCQLTIQESKEMSTDAEQEEGSKKTINGVHVFLICMFLIAMFLFRNQIGGLVNPAATPYDQCLSFSEQVLDYRKELNAGNIRKANQLHERLQEYPYLADKERFLSFLNTPFLSNNVLSGVLVDHCNDLKNKMAAN